MKDQPEDVDVVNVDISIRHEIVTALSPDFIERHLSKEIVMQLERKIRMIYSLPPTKKLDGIYLFPNSNILFVFSFEKGKLLIEKTQASIIVQVVTSKTLYNMPEKEEYDDGDLTE